MQTIEVYTHRTPTSNPCPSIIVSINKAYPQLRLLELLAFLGSRVAAADEPYLPHDRLRIADGRSLILDKHGGWRRSIGMMLPIEYAIKHLPPQEVSVRAMDDTATATLP